MDAEQLNAILRAPARELLDASSRLYLGYLFGAVLLAGVVGRLRGSRWQRIWRFSWRTIHHASFKTDLALFVGAAALSAMIAPGLSPIGREGAILAARVFRMVWDPRSVSALRGPFGAFLYAALFFLVDDLSRYLLHRALHRFPLLWRFHRLHHSAVLMTPLTFKRQHPVEVVLFGLRYALVVAVVSGLGFAMSGRFLRLSEWGSGAALVFSIYFVSSNLRHSHVRLGWGKALETIFISPAQHQVHHGRERWMQNSNFGSTLAIWDAIWGSLVRSDEVRVTRFGLARGGPRRKERSRVAIGSHVET